MRDNSPLPQITAETEFEPIPVGKTSWEDIVLYHIREITFEEKAPRKEAFENVLSAMRIDGVNVIYLIHGDKTGVHFYLGVVKDLYETSEISLELSDIGEQILEPSLRGNFRGSVIDRVSEDEKREIVEKMRGMTDSAQLEGVPGVIEDNEKYQGVDRLVDVMLGDEFCFLIIAKPLKAFEINYIEKNLYSIYTRLAPFSKVNLQQGESSGDGITKTSTYGTSKSESENISHTDSVNSSESVNSSKSETKTTGGGTSESKTEGKSTSRTDRGSANDKTTGDNASKSYSTNKSLSESENTTSGISRTSGTGVSDSTGTTKSNSTSTTSATAESENKSASFTTSVELVKKDYQDFVNYIDEIIIPRLDYGKGKGIFVSAAFLFTNCKGKLIKLENTVKSLYAGNKGNKAPLMQSGCLPIVNNSHKHFQLQRGKIKGLGHKDDFILEYQTTLTSRFILPDNTAIFGSWLSTNELGLVTGLPQREIVGLALREEVEFGLNSGVIIPSDRQIKLGNLVQSGRAINEVSVSLDKNALDKHIFITGTTGSGKTTTCQSLLLNSELPFLVIEPAKTEYRALLGERRNLLVFTLGNDSLAPFRLNPFELYRHESVISRIDMIKASIEASFDMEAAIPQIIEKAIYDCYIDYGWNVKTNRNVKYEDPFADGVYAFPTLSDLIKKINTVVEEQGFDERLKNDYIGSVKARLQSLLLGSKGLMLDTRRSINFESLLESHVVLELDEIHNPAEKSLIMGFILANLNEALKAKYKSSEGKFKHITLIEEAHRLLSKYEYGDSLNKKHGVEVFTDMLAEVRKYGESLIIADQIPSKLTPEILKNTNTKIVHKIFARDDKDAIGNTMALTDEQKDYLSSLDPPGRAIVFSQGWSKAMQIQISRRTNTSDTFEDERIIREKIVDYYCDNYKRGILQGFENYTKKPNGDDFEHFIEFINDSELEDAFAAYFVSNISAESRFREALMKNLELYDRVFLAKYLAGRYRADNAEKIEELLSELESKKKDIDFHKYDNTIKFDKRQ